MTTRLLVLGGSRFQIPLIRRAKSRGLHVITCDYLPDNPGHALADEYHDVSTTNAEGVLALARRIGIDAVVSMSSDPAMPTVAYVAQALGLPGPPTDAVRSLTDKQAFRRLMADLGLPTPRYWGVDASSADADVDFVAALPEDVSRFVVKPVDSSGSRGITVVSRRAGDLGPALQRALAHSRSRRAIVEEYVEGDQVHGDGYLLGGRLVHHYLGDHAFFTRSGSSVPISTTWPSRHGDEVLCEVARQVETIATACGFVEGPVNIEARVTPAGEIVVIEIGPRNGGNHIPVLQHRLTGFDFVDKVLDGALGLRPTLEPGTAKRGVGAAYILHADRDGTFAGLHVHREIERRLVVLDVFRRVGDPVAVYVGSNTSIGVALMQFAGIDERDRLLVKLPSQLAVQVRSSQSWQVIARLRA